MQAFGYARVSTAGQAESGLSLDQQTNRIKLWGLANGNPDIEVLVDAGVSAKIPLNKRPAGKEACRRLKGGSTVVILKLDRAFRNTLECLEFVEAMNNYGSSIVILDLKGSVLDTRTAMGKFFLTIVSAVGELERGMIAERTREALKAKAKKRERVGSVPIGFKESKGGKLVPCDKERETLSMLKALQREGLSIRSIADVANNAKGVTNRGKPFTKSSVHRWLNCSL